MNICCRTLRMNKVLKLEDEQSPNFKEGMSTEGYKSSNRTGINLANCTTYLSFTYMQTHLALANGFFGFCFQKGEL